MKKIFATLALGIVLMSSAIAIPYEMKDVYPVYSGSISDPGVKVIESQGDIIFVVVNGQMYVIKK